LRSAPRTSRTSSWARSTPTASTTSSSTKGTSRWNKIEHYLFSFIARNWRGQPLVSRQAVVSLIGATTSTRGLKAFAQLDEHTYERGIRITDQQLAEVNLTTDQFHGEWNYTISPHLIS